MRIESVSYLVNEEIRSGKITYPDLWCFAFNPCYLQIDMDDQSLNNIFTLTLQANLTSYNINALLFHGKATVYISKVLQLFFTNPERKRWASIDISIMDGETAILKENLTLNVVWGGLRIGEQFGIYGAFRWNGMNLSYTRDVVWFKNFPFNVSLFRSKGDEVIRARCDETELDDRWRIFRCVINFVVEGDLPEFYDIAPMLSSPIIILNKTHGKIYAMDRLSAIGSKAYYMWSSSGIYGGTLDYMSNGEIRTDTEFSYNEEIVHWNKDTKELESMNVGNAETNGVFDLNPALAFSSASHFAQYNVVLSKVTSAIFDMNFDFPFPDTSNVSNEIVNLFISEAKDGIYLRWLDKFGFLQYYLFREGTSSIKNSVSSDVVKVERQYNGMYYGGLERTTEIISSETIKCCAVNLPKRILEYVKTIVSAPIVDMYLGTTKQGSQLWLPISVSSGTYSTDPKTLLSDYEIEIEKTDNISQTL